MAETERSWGQRNIGDPLRRIFQPVGEAGRAIGQPVGDALRGAMSPIGENAPRFVLGPAPEPDPAIEALMAPGGGRSGAVVGVPTTPEKDTRTPFGKWLGGVSASMAAAREAESARVRAATGSGDLPGTSPLARAWGFFTDTPEEAALRAAATEQFKATDWNAVREGKLAEMVAADEARYVPATSPVAANAVGVPGDKTKRVTRADLAFSPIPDAQRVTGRGDLRMPELMEYTPEQARAQEIAAALQGLTAGQLQTLMSAIPGPPAQPSPRDMVIADLRGIAMSDYLEAMNDPAASREEQIAARQTLLQTLLATAGNDPYAALAGGQ